MRRGRTNFKYECGKFATRVPRRAAQGPDQHRGRRGGWALRRSSARSGLRERASVAGMALWESGPDRLQTREC